MTNIDTKISDTEALEYHLKPRPGKMRVVPTKAMDTQRDLSLAYSPGVAAPCLAIQEDPDKAYDYTIKGNLVAVISNGTAVLGLGDLGAQASKPVMEGKVVLFKRFADIDAVDLEVDTRDPETFINCVRYLGPSFGGINLEDIKAPECFVIEDRLKELMDIPVFHDDQHGTAIITLAALINAAHITKRQFNQLRLVVNGAGAAAIACVELIKAMGVPHDHVIMCDTQGVIYQGRTEGMNQWKAEHAVETPLRTLTEALIGADAFLGLSVKGAVTADMVASMAVSPIIFAMANPDPEISPEEVRAVRQDAIIATGRSDYPNQVNNVMGFPYIFRGALDVRATTINNEMKIAAATALAYLAREHVPEEVLTAYAGRHMQYGPEYIIPVPFDPRLLTTIPSAVAQAAIQSGVAKKIIDIESYKQELSFRLNPMANTMGFVFQQVRANPKRIIFSEGEEEQVIRTALLFYADGYGTPILVGKEKRIREKIAAMGASEEGIVIQNAALQSERVHGYIDFLYKRLQRKGYLYRDCARLVNRERNIFAACMVACGDADGVVSGITRGYTRTLSTFMHVIDPVSQHRVFGISLLMAQGRSLYIADTAVHEEPTPVELADMAIQTAAMVRSLGDEPRVALLSFSNFGHPPEFKKAEGMRQAVKELEARNVDFEFDGEMSVEVALNKDLLKLYPFCRLSAPANVLIMPGIQSANISSKLLRELGGGSLIGPILVGTEKPVQVIQMGATVSDILHLAAFAAIAAKG